MNLNFYPLVKRYYSQEGNQIDFQGDFIFKENHHTAQFKVVRSIERTDIGFIDGVLINHKVEFITSRQNPLTGGALFDFLTSWLNEEMQRNESEIYKSFDFTDELNYRRYKFHYDVISDIEPYNISFKIEKIGLNEEDVYITTESDGVNLRHFTSEQGLYEKEPRLKKFLDTFVIKKINEVDEFKRIKIL